MGGEGQKLYKGFRDLQVWQEARAFKQAVYELVKCFPAEEKYRLTDQLIRAARSIGANIAEGYGRFTYKDQLHFCIQACGSLLECSNHLTDALDCGYITAETLQTWDARTETLERLLNGYLTWLRKMSSPSKAP